MSIWIDLLFMHGHFATPRVLEHLLTPSTQPAEPAAGPDQSAPGPGAGPNACGDATPRPDRSVRYPEPYVVSFPSVVHHPFRAIGQLS